MSFEPSKIPAVEIYTNGIFNSNIEIKRTKTDNSFRGFIKSSNLIVNKVLVGGLDLSVNGNTQLNSYSINWNVFKDKKNTFLGIGNLIYDKSSSKLDLDISFSDFDISFSSYTKKGLCILHI